YSMSVLLLVPASRLAATACAGAAAHPCGARTEASLRLWPVFHAKLALRLQPKAPGQVKPVRSQSNAAVTTHFLSTALHRGVRFPLLQVQVAFEAASPHQPFENAAGHSELMIGAGLNDAAAVEHENSLR